MAKCHDREGENFGCAGGGGRAAGTFPRPMHWHRAAAKCSQRSTSKEFARNMTLPGLTECFHPWYQICSQPVIRDFIIGRAEAAVECAASSLQLHHALGVGASGASDVRVYQFSVVCSIMLRCVAVWTSPSREHTALVHYQFAPATAHSPRSEFYLIQSAVLRNPAIIPCHKYMACNV